MDEQAAQTANDVDEPISMPPEALLELPVTIPLVVAARAFGLARTKAYELAKAGQFPCRVIKVGARFRVPRSALFAELGYADPLKDAIKGSTPRPAA